MTELWVCSDCEQALVNDEYSALDSARFDAVSKGVRQVGLLANTGKEVEWSTKYCECCGAPEHGPRYAFEREEKPAPLTYLDPSTVQSTQRTESPRYGRNASGYGRKIPICWKLRIGNVWRRVYAICFSNCATHYVLIKGKPHYLGSYNPFPF
jgi:hypothetical protein